MRRELVSSCFARKKNIRECIGPRQRERRDSDFCSNNPPKGTSGWGHTRSYWLIFGHGGGARQDVIWTLITKVHGGTAKVGEDMCLLLHVANWLMASLVLRRLVVLT
jgi:hypothetical protein